MPQKSWLAIKTLEPSYVQREEKQACDPMAAGQPSLSVWGPWPQQRMLATTVLLLGSSEDFCSPGPTHAG